MLKFLAGGTLISRIFVWLAIIALVLGYAGNLLKNFAVTEVPISFFTAAKIVADSFVENLRIFVPKLDARAGSDNWLLTIGRLLGSIVAFAATFAILFRAFKEDFSRFFLAFSKNHAVIIGFDQTAKSFAKSLKKASKASVVIVDPFAKTSVAEKANLAKYHYLASDMDSMSKTLRICRAHKASSLLISIDKDETNLEALSAVSKLATRYPDTAFELTVCLDNVRLVETLEREDKFFELTGPNVVTHIFNQSRESAVTLLQRTSFVDMALSRGQNRVHLVVIGDSDAAVETVIQFLRISPAVGLQRPRIDWMVADEGSLLARLHARNQALYELVKSDRTENASGALPLRWALEVCIHELSAGSLLPDRNIILKLESLSGGAVTAIVVAGRPEDENTSVSLVLRRRLARMDAWRAPIYVLSVEKSALDIFLRRYEPTIDTTSLRFLRDIKGVDRPEEVIEPFGRIENLCRIDALARESDVLPMQVHAAYLSHREQDEGKKSDKVANVSAKRWEELPETYKIASRRSAMHIPVKLLSAGVGNVHGAGQNRTLEDVLAKDTRIMEALAKIEHDAWSIDRELDGWRYGKERDNERKLHPDLVPYNKLQESTKEYDRVQIRFLASLPTN